MRGLVLLIPARLGDRRTAPSRWWLGKKAVAGRYASACGGKKVLEHQELPACNCLRGFHILTPDF